ncbi:MAG: hypothetical protein NDJ90_04780 [Oligoflexia bacterium]|nr:hypothetical protein [Oligoflexia bacterium]
MIYLKVDDLDNWIRKFDLEVIEYVCPKCNRGFKSSVPFVMKGYVGLETPIHECGPNYRDIVVVPTDPEKIKFWNSVL